MKNYPDAANEIKAWTTWPRRQTEGMSDGRALELVQVLQHTAGKRSDVAHLHGNRPHAKKTLRRIVKDLQLE